MAALGSETQRARRRRRQACPQQRQPNSYLGMHIYIFQERTAHLITKYQDKQPSCRECESEPPNPRWLPAGCCQLGGLEPHAKFHLQRSNCSRMLSTRCSGRKSRAPVIVCTAEPWLAQTCRPGPFILHYLHVTSRDLMHQL